MFGYEILFLTLPFIKKLIFFAFLTTYPIKTLKVVRFRAEHITSFCLSTEFSVEAQTG